MDIEKLKKHPKCYYSTDNGVLLHGDCAAIMPELEQMDLVLTDPPYGIKVGGARGKIGGARGIKGRKKKFHPKEYGECLWDKSRPTQKIFDMMLSISKHQIIFGGNYFIDYLQPTPCFLVWDKKNGNSFFADCELAWTSFSSATRIIKYRWNGCMQETPETRYHPTQKPVGLFLWILDKYSKSGDSILDPFLGSGTTAIACERLNYKWIGIEKEEKYCEVATQRIENEAKQLKFW